MPTFSDAEVRLSIFRTAVVWAEYREWLPADPDHPKLGDFVSNFVGDWKVARTLNSKRIEELLKKAPSFLRRLRNARASEVDALAEQLMNDGLSKRTKAGGYSRPISFCSKIAFLSNPRAFVPMDSFSVKGMKHRYSLRPGTYAGYLRTFNDLFHVEEPSISEAIEDLTPWRSSGLRELIPEKGVSFRRKCFDDLLMMAGGKYERI
jgi:hypothetical protein